MTSHATALPGRAVCHVCCRAVGIGGCCSCRDEPDPYDELVR